MAKITTITNPLTGQPAQVDQLDHTAQQIDVAIARALPGGAIDTALQKKAPAGFGYGDAMEVFSGTEAELENAFSSIIAALPRFSSKQIAFTCDDGTLYGKGRFSAVIYKDNDGYAHLTASVYNNNYSVFKSCFGGVWHPFEWVNPPKELGVEYRTTERYNNGKPVYVKCFDFGPLPNNTDLGSPHGVVGLTHGIRYELIGVNDNSCMTHYGGITGIYNGAAELHVSTNTNLSHISVNACIWYIKD